jgi:hypothetical protein
MKVFKTIFIAGLITIANLGVNAQTKGFSKQPDVFIGELSDLMKSTREKAAEDAFEHFKILWSVGRFTGDQQALIMRNCEEMLYNKFNINPEYTLFLKTLSAAKDSGVLEAKINDWLKASQNAIAGPAKSFVPFVTASLWLFSENAIYISESKKWVTSPSDYKITFSKDQVTVAFRKIDLYCNAADDYILISTTSGVWDMNKQTFTGSGGILDWSRAGFAPGELFAEIGSYKIDLTKAEFKADSVWLKYPKLTADKLLGKLEDRPSAAQLSSGKEDFSESPYPQFTSFRKDIVMGQFSAGRVKLKSGIQLKGAKITADGTAKEKATIELYYKNKLMVKALSENFSIGENKIRSLKTEVTIFTDSGEIYHPILHFDYDIGRELLTLSRGSEGLEQAPFFDNDHNLEIWVDQIIWKLDEPRINFDMILNDAMARFESANFYREFNFEKIMGMLGYHPLVRMSKYCSDHKKWQFTLGEYASATGSKKENLKPQIIMLADEGFLYFDPITEIIRVKPKLINYVRNHFKLADYDVIRFGSVIGSRPNAYLNLVNYDMVIEGVRAFRFSDSQNVAVIPTEQVITVKNNRRLQFGGRVTAGRFDFFAPEFDFSYELFNITSEFIDSMKIFYPDSLEGKFLIPVKTVLRDINGTLYIDKSSNKSGLVDFPEYPIFISRSKSVIAYDKKEIFNGAYKKEVFRFDVDPFTIDSLDNFTISGLKFPGNFVSGGILPEFKYEASIMKDYSLGFERQNPPGGYEMYGGVGHGEIDISLSERGFWAKGEIQYQGASLFSDKIVMMPDSANAEVKEYSIKENARYPKLLAMDVLSRWKPMNDSMYINTKGHTVDIFRDNQTFKGNLVQTSKELSGTGILEWEEARLTSADMKFKPNGAKAEISMIEIGDMDSNKLSLSSPNVKADVDFTARKGDFIANEKGLLTELPFNKYATSMDRFNWDMDSKTVLFTNQSLKPEESVLVSRHGEQAALTFQCTKALFNMQEGVIYAEEIPWIDVADSRVFPADGKAIIDKDASMRILENAKLQAARGNRYHELYNCKIRILGKYAISGDGLYKYKDKHNTGQILYLDKMRVTRDTTVQLLGYITDSLSFFLSPKIAYKGPVELLSNERYLGFNGYVKPVHDFKGIPSQWFRFTDRPDPDEVIINASDPKNEDKRSMSLSMNLAQDSMHIYPTFFHFKRVYADPQLTTDTGVFFYDEKLNEFRMGDRDRLLNNSPRGSFMSFNDKTRIIESQGKIDLGLNLHEKFNAYTAGKIYKHEDDSTFTVESMLGLKMVLPDDCYKRLLAVIEKSGNEAPGIDLKEDYLYNALAEFLDDKKLEKVTKEINEKGELRLFDEIDRSLVFTKVNLQISNSKQAIISNEPIELASVQGTAINKKFNSKIMMTRKRSGTRLIIYMEVSKYDWFYFDYARGILSVYSTDKEFNDAVIQKSKKINERGYVLKMASPRNITKFIDMMNQ